MLAYILLYIGTIAEVIVPNLLILDVLKDKSHPFNFYSHEDGNKSITDLTQVYHPEERRKHQWALEKFLYDKVLVLNNDWNPIPYMNKLNPAPVFDLFPEYHHHHLPSATERSKGKDGTTTRLQDPSAIAEQEQQKKAYRNALPKQATFKKSFFLHITFNDQFIHNFHRKQLLLKMMMRTTMLILPINIG